MNSKRALIALHVLVMGALACNLQLAGANSTPDLPGTITAQALTLQAPAAPAATPTASGSDTPSVPEASVTSPTNCRTGPGTAYDLVLTMNPGQNFQVVGKDTPDAYWIVDNPAGGTCWLWGQNTVISGNTSALPEFPPPPRPTAKFTKTPKPSATPTDTSAPGIGITFIPPIIILLPPAGPTNLAQSRSCGGGFNGLTPIWIEVAHLTWTDNATNESGYHIYKGGAMISPIPANSTDYTITMRYPQGTGGALYDTFLVAAYNVRGESPRAGIDVPTCP